MVRSAETGSLGPSGRLYFYSDDSEEEVGQFLFIKTQGLFFHSFMLHL